MMINENLLESKQGGKPLFTGNSARTIEEKSKGEEACTLTSP
jgi:hypothetical protein